MISKAVSGVFFISILKYCALPSTLLLRLRSFGFKFFGLCQLKVKTGFLGFLLVIWDAGDIMGENKNEGIGF